MGRNSTNRARKFLVQRTERQAWAQWVEMGAVKAGYWCGEWRASTKRRCRERTWTTLCACCSLTK